jgi:hypothetical protein
MNYAKVSSFAGMEAAERAVPAGCVVAVTVCDSLPDGEALAVLNRVRVLGWVLTNPARLQGKIERANAAAQAAAALRGVTLGATTFQVASRDASSRSLGQA